MDFKQINYRNEDLGSKPVSTFEYPCVRSYTIERLFLSLCNDKYKYCRKCIFTPLRRYEGFILDECCNGCPKLLDKGIWFLSPPRLAPFGLTPKGEDMPLTPPLSPVHLRLSRRNSECTTVKEDCEEYKTVCNETRIIVDFCVWCSLTNNERNKNTLKNFFVDYRKGAINESLKIDVLFDMTELGFFSDYFKLIDSDADYLENF